MPILLHIDAKGWVSDFHEPALLEYQSYSLWVWAFTLVWLAKLMYGTQNSNWNTTSFYILQWIETYGVLATIPETWPSSSARLKAKTQKL